MTASALTASPEAPAHLPPLEFLTVLYGGAEAKGAVEFRFLPSGKRVFMPWPIFDGHPDLFTLEQAPAGQQVYFGISLRKDSSGGSKENCLPTHLQWVDFDLKGTPYTGGRTDVLNMTPEELREAAQVLCRDVLAKAEALGLPVRLVVYSGHGLQVYWARPARSTLEDTERYNRALVAEYGPEYGADTKTVDAQRIFRVPGGRNLKNPARPLPVEVWYIDAGAVTPRESLEALAQAHAPRPAPPPPPRLKRPTPAPPEQGDVIQAFNARYDIHEMLTRYGYTRDGDRYTRPGEDASGRDVKLLENARGVLCSYHHSSNDPLADTPDAAHLQEPFDLYRLYEHSGDYRAAVKAAAEELGLSPVDGEGIRVGPRQAAPALEWGPRQPLPPKLPPVPTMPPEMLPPALRGWLVDAAELACVPLEGMAAPAVVGLSGLIGRSVRIDPEGLGDWIVTPNLWGGVVLRPSALKSMQLDRALEPLQALENRARDEFRDGEIDRELRLESLKAQEEQIKKAARTKGGSLDLDALRKLREELREAAPVATRYVVNNVTYEKLGELLGENPRGLTMVRDELAGWIDHMSREENAEARGFFLTSWNGDGSYDFDRIGRGTVRVDHLCLAVVGMIQPGPMQQFLRRSRAGTAGDVGLLQRFQLLIYPDGMPKWVRRGHPADPQAKARAFAVYEALDTLRRSAEPVTLTFTDEAQAVFREWRDTLENRLRGGELVDSPAFESHLGKYRSLVPSLALIFHLVEVAQAHPDPATLPPVSIDALELALNWAEFLELHARKVYAVEVGGFHAPAYALVDKIKAGAVRDGDRLYALRRKEWAGLKDEELGLALSALTEWGWVQVEVVETGGRPAEVLRLHPELTGGEA
ncbi:YfjI family protein [Deinococcus sp. YIM 77859]|uniref:YfjI family protein n=1 Tax=Deinococcus sp. YIM 77859 TaxID=1540221 RepID=UPI00054F4672|nr:YfjI family protein [Deinococcus sp. YIM 77859]